MSIKWPWKKYPKYITLTLKGVLVGGRELYLEGTWTAKRYADAVTLAVEQA